MPKKIPMRRCVGCMEMKEKTSLVRVVRSPEGELSLDLTGLKLDGELQAQLDRFHDDGKNPNPMAKGMSWIKTNVMQMLRIKNFI